MKPSLILLPLILVLLSCSSDKEDLDLTHCPVKWQLVKMSGGFSPVPPATGSAMEWQEWYLLYPNGTFSKTRERDQRVIEKTGTYSIVTQSDGKYLELVYPSENELIGNCYAEPKEQLIIKSEEELIGTWSMCDGPGLFYQRVEYNCADLPAEK